MATIMVENSVTKLTGAHQSAVLVAGSHGGVYAGYLAARAKVGAVILNDAGVGKDNAGIGALDFLDALGIPAATVDAWSARIGDGRDMLQRGIISHCNRVAAAANCTRGMPAEAAASALTAAAAAAGDVPAYNESRFLLDSGGAAEVWGIDSAALVRAEDAGQILVCGSHGGLLAGQPGAALRVEALAVCFHDAGVGIDDAGISRLPVLAARGIAAATVAGDTARIGDARSLWETGRISHVNPVADAAGIAAGQTVAAFAATVQAAPPSTK